MKAYVLNSAAFWPGRPCCSANSYMAVIEMRVCKASISHYVQAISLGCVSTGGTFMLQLLSKCMTKFLAAAQPTSAGVAWPPSKQTVDMITEQVQRLRPDCRES